MFNKLQHDTQIHNAVITKVFDVNEKKNKNDKNFRHYNFFLSFQTPLKLSIMSNLSRVDICMNLI